MYTRMCIITHTKTSTYIYLNAMVASIGHNKEALSCAHHRARRAELTGVFAQRAHGAH